MVQHQLVVCKLVTKCCSLFSPCCLLSHRNCRFWFLDVVFCSFFLFSGDAILLRLQTRASGLAHAQLQGAHTQTHSPPPCCLTQTQKQLEGVDANDFTGTVLRYVLNFKENYLSNWTSFMSSTAFRAAGCRNLKSYMNTIRMYQVCFCAAVTRNCWS